MQIEKLLEDVALGKLSPAAAARRLRGFPFEDLRFAKVDHHRTLRCGWPEVIYCAGKTPRQVVEIAAALAARNPLVLATRVDPKQRAALARRFGRQVRHNPMARTVLIGARPRPSRGLVVVATAGTSDIPVAEEARVTAEALGAKVSALYDVGVAGIHRLMDKRPELEKADAIVVAAGMEGALASVVGGLVSCPVIAVPTSVGYGASFGGLAPLLAMINSCAAGVAVVNIDNGFGAGYMAALIARVKKS